MAEVARRAISGLEPPPPPEPLRPKCDDKALAYLIKLRTSLNLHARQHAANPTATDWRARWEAIDRALLVVMRYILGVYSKDSTLRGLGLSQVMPPPSSEDLLAQPDWTDPEAAAKGPR